MTTLQKNTNCVNALFVTKSEHTKTQENGCHGVTLVKCFGRHAMQCEICGAKLASSIAGKAGHMKLYHHVKITTRTKPEIIQEVEARLGKALIDWRRCVEGCQCYACFQKALDAFVALTEANLDATRIAFNQHDDLSSDEL